MEALRSPRLGPRSLEGRVGLPPGLPTASCPHTLEAVRGSGGILSGPPEGQAGRPISEPTAALEHKGGKASRGPHQEGPGQVPEQAHAQTVKASWVAGSVEACVWG